MGAPRSKSKASSFFLRWPSVVAPIRASQVGASRAGRPNQAPLRRRIAAGARVVPGAFGSAIFLTRLSKASSVR
jgi:hypothetical protein